MAKEKNKIVEVLKKRDGLTEPEARDLMNDTRSEMEDAIANGDYELAEEIFESDLGLELDYLFDLF